MKQKRVGKKVLEALTNDQIVHLLDEVFTLSGTQETETLLSNLPADIAGPLSEILRPGKATSKKIVSDKKHLEKWRKLWRRWADIESRLGDEDGDYVAQEHDWEAPYFDGSALAEDMEGIAKEMLPLLEKTYALGKEEDDLFEEAIFILEKGIKSYPEWMGAEYGDSCHLESTVTECLLRWRWLASNSALTFLNEVVRFEDELELMELDRGAITDFFLDLPEEDRRKIYEHITEHQDDGEWCGRLDSPHSEWHQIHHALAKMFDPDAHLDACRRMLEKNWRYGLPLIKELLKKKDHAGAEKMCEQTVASFFKDGRRREEKMWRPEGSLLIAAPMYTGTSVEVVRLLKDWIGMTKKLGMATRTAALSFQLVTYQTPHKWDKVKKAVQQTDLSQVSHLIEEWQMFAVDVSLRYGLSHDNMPSDCWVKWLTDAGLDETKGRPWFSGKLKKWLTALGKDAKKFKNEARLVHTLTQDLADISDLGKSHPCLLEATEVSEGEKRNISSRRAWLGKMGAQQLVPPLVGCWRKHVVGMLPDPKHADQSRYEDHALWLDLVRELDPASFEKILDQWREAHKRRRNLWKALERRGMR